jgi:hypothetical protein
MRDPKLETPYQALRWTYGLVPFLAGLDKFFNLLTDWPKYLSPAMASMLPFSAATFMHIVGVIEMVVGIAVLTRFTRLGAYVASAWLTLIALNLILLGSYDIAVRDLAMAVGAFVLARMDEARQG